jgi:DNA-binding HxlR family transcriptional regulator
MIGVIVSIVNQVPMGNYQLSKSGRSTRVEPDAFIAACPSRSVLTRLGEKWALLAIAALVPEPLHFGELRRRLEGVSQKMLTQTLRALERDGLVCRRVLNTRPIRVEYSLSSLGMNFAGHAMALKHWAEEHLRPIKQRQTVFDRRRDV